MDIEAIDLVYTWCDDADAVWRAKRLAVAKACGLTMDDAANAQCRYAGHDELKYSLRSVEMHLPWIRKVFLVIDDVITPPSWLDLAHPRFQIVRLSEIMPDRALPCFCSTNIEHHLAFIPGLAEHFLYANDDVMVYRPLTPSFFYAPDGKPYFRFKGKPKASDWKPKNSYHARIKHAEEVVRAHHEELTVGVRRAMARLPHHNVDAYCATDMKETYRTYAREIQETFSHPFRRPDNVQRVIYAYEALAQGCGHYRLSSGGFLNWVKRRLGLACADSIQFVREGWKSGLRRLEVCRPGLFCFNDTLETTDADRDWLEKSVYQKLFPNPSSFERQH